MTSDHPRHPTVLAAAVALAALAFVAGCESSGSSTSDPTTTAATTTVSTVDPDPAVDAVTGIAVHGIAGDEIGAWTDETIQDCGARSVRFERGEDLVEVVAWHADCTPDRALNGQHGVYTELTDERVPSGATAVDVAIGRAVGFSQTYTECTNSCEDHVEPVVLVELAEPASDDHPIVMLVSPYGELDLDDLLEIAAGLTQER